MKLFLIPFAGGSSLSYAQWKNYFSSSVDVIPIELNGRGVKEGFPFYQSFSGAVASISEEIDSYLHTNEKFVIFGHSMGALLAFEIFHYRFNKGKSLPYALFLSGSRPPFLVETRRQTFSLPTPKLIEKLRQMGGTPEVILNNKEFIDYLLPIVRADFQLLDRYQYTPKKKLLQCPVIIFGGKDDTITEDELVQWQLLSEPKVKLHMFEGNHFFIQYHVLAIVNIIENQLMNKISRR